MPISSLHVPGGYVYAYAERDDAIKTSLRLKEMKDELTAMIGLNYKHLAYLLRFI